MQRCITMPSPDVTRNELGALPSQTSHRRKLSSPDLIHFVMVVLIPAYITTSAGERYISPNCLLIIIPIHKYCREARHISFHGRIYMPHYCRIKPSYEWNLVGSPHKNHKKQQKDFESVLKHTCIIPVQHEIEGLATKTLHNPYY